MLTHTIGDSNPCPAGRSHIDDRTAGHQTIQLTHHNPTGHKLRCDALILKMALARACCPEIKSAPTAVVPLQSGGT